MTAAFLRRQEPEQEIRGPSDRRAAPSFLGDKEVHKNSTEEQVEHIVRIHLGVDEMRRGSFEDVAELWSHREPKP